MMGLAQRLNDKSPKKESNVTVTPKKAGKKKNKRTVSDRSPANAARKKASTENTMNHSRVDDVEDKENRTPVRSPEPVQKATPYWKVCVCINCVNCANWCEDPLRSGGCIIKYSFLISHK
jgi:hypothetical protein